MPGGRSASRLTISVENPGAIEHGVIGIDLDGARQASGHGIPLVDDGRVHRVRVELGA